MEISRIAFNAIKKALMAINPDNSKMNVSVDNYFCYNERNERFECLQVTDMVHDTGYPVISLYRYAEND